MTGPPKRYRVTITPTKADQLRELQTAARRVNGQTPPDHPDRKASEQLTTELARLHAAGATFTDLGRAIGVHRQTVHIRLARHGYADMPPSMASETGYQGTEITVSEARPPRLSCGTRLDLETVDALDALAEHHGALRPDIIRGAIALALRAPSKIRPVQ